MRVAVLLALAAGRGRSGVRRGVARRVTPRSVVDVLGVLGEGVVRESKPGGTPSAGAPWPARVALRGAYLTGKAAKHDPQWGRVGPRGGAAVLPN